VSQQDVLVPDIGSDAADVIEILVKPGDAVRAEQPIVVLESAKASMEVPCPQAGTVAAINVQVGQSVKQGDVLLQLESESAPVAPAPDVPVSTAAAPEQPATAAASESAGDVPVRDMPVQEAPAASEIRIVKVPDIGSDSADVIEILVREGQQIELEQPLVALESAKASMEVPNTVAGTVQRILVKVGDQVSENTALLEVATAAGAGAAAAPTAALPDAAPSPAGKPATAALLPSTTLRALASAVSHAASSHVHAGPAVRRLARELGVDLAKVKGTGPRERILKEDVHAFVKKAMQQPATNTGSGVVLPVIDFAKWGTVERVALTKIQKLSAQNLHRAWVTIPHVTQFDEADITELEQFRVAQKESFKAEGLSLTLLSFLVKACAHVLGEFPRFNSSLELDGEHLVVKKYIHIGVAVDTPNGLVVPVIRDADKKSIREIARDLGELSLKARDRKLTPAEMQGATFSISSLGGIGGTAFTPIVNWPEVAILGVSRHATKPAWDGKQFQPRLMLPLSLSYDHRVIDGADAARFTAQLAKELGDIRELLL
jgi:pyruvate dehydrogenase E2 component (dihydrolipoamide acetyltransferase)